MLHGYNSLSLRNVFEKCLVTDLLLGNFTTQVSCYCFDVNEHLLKATLKWRKKKAFSKIFIKAEYG